MKRSITNPNSNLEINKKIILAADVGATKTNIALYSFDKGELIVIQETRYISANYTSFLQLLKDFQWQNKMPDVISIAFAGPIIRGEAKATNLNWSININRLRKELQIESIFLINDLKAHAYGLHNIKKHQLEVVQKGNSQLNGNMAVIAPGTGLGEAGLYCDGVTMHPFATEGGHSDFSPRTKFDDDFLKHLRIKYGHVSWERLLSGNGIWEICQFLQKGEHFTLPSWMINNLNIKDKAQLVSRGAKAGDPLCSKTMKLFFYYLAIETANLAVKLKSTGGIYIGGGIVPKNIELLDIKEFLKHFQSMGRLTYMLKQIPIYIVLDDKTALKGAAYYGADYINITRSNLTAKSLIK